MEEEGLDRISELPEGILHHILSFLLTKDAIQISPTCKTLNQVWTNHPFLDLGEKFFPILPRKMEDNGNQNIEEAGNLGDQNIEEAGHQGDQNIEEAGHQGDNIVEEDDGDQNIEAEEQPSSDKDGDDNDDDDDDGDDADSSTEDDEEDREVVLRKREKLLTFVEQTLTRMRMQDITIQKFRLGWTNLDVELMQYLDRWIHSLVHCNINELVLQINLKEYKMYDLPPILLAAPSLHALNLTRCRMPSGSIPLWPSLRKLELRNAYLDEKFLLDIISSCPDLEILLLMFCRGFVKRILVPARSKLRVLYVNLDCQVVPEEFVVEAHNLERITYGGGLASTMVNIITNFESRLKFLQLCGANITNTWLCELIPRLSRLEELWLTQLNSKAIEISSSSLKRLSLHHVFHYKDNRIGEFTIDAPNLVELNYFGCLSCVFRNSLAAKKVILIISDLRDSKCTDELVCKRLMQFLHKFDSSEEVTLDCTLFEHMIFPVEARLNLLAPLPRIKSLILQGKLLSSSIDVLPDLLKCLLWMAPNLVSLSLKDKESNEVYPIDLTKVNDGFSSKKVVACDILQDSVQLPISSNIVPVSDVTRCKKFLSPKSEGSTS